MSKLVFSAWLDYAQPASLDSFQANAPLLSRVYPHSYGSGPGGLPLLRPEASAELRRAVAEAAKAGGAEVWPSASNWNAVQRSHDGALMALILGNASTRRMHISQLRLLVQSDKAQGINLDYRQLADSQREAYSLFVEELCATFHQAGLKVGVSVHAKADAEGQVEGSVAQDWHRLGAAADCLQLLCLDYHCPEALPGPLSPPDWCFNELQQALLRVPAAKLALVLPGHGSLWGRTVPAQALGWAAWDTLRETHAPERRDAATAELSLRYPGHEAWFNDAISLTAKLYQARDLGVGQAALAGLGAEDPRLWAFLDTLPDPYLRKRA